MLLFYRICVIFYVFITTIEGVHSYCNRTAYLENCAYDVYCYDDFYLHRNDDTDIDGFGYYSYNERNNDYSSGNHDEDFVSHSCNYIQYDTGYQGQLFYPIHVTYKKTGFSDSQKVPKQYSVNVLITELDFSGNNYQYIPAIRQLDNLALLNVSNNLLTVAKLCNMEQLPKLSDIDFSYNNINDIITEPGQAYRTLKKIDLSYNYLTTIREAVFDQFNELETLDVSHNYIETLSPITFEGIKQLKHLNLSFNKISDINSSLFRFVDLKLLDLSSNIIKTIKATDFSKLTNLEILDLNSNLISVIEKQSFDNMPILQSLYLNKNKMIDVDKEMFKNLTALKTINLSDNIFRKMPKNMFKNKIIQWFSIQNNQLEGALERGMFEGLAVTQLDLSYQGLTSIEDYAFSGLVNVLELLLNNNNISMISLNSFKDLHSLQKLDLSFNNIQSIEFIKDDLYHLLSLSLRNNNLTVIKHENFHGLNSLQFLDLSDNKITQVESNSFISLKDLINFQISNNPLSGTLEGNTFDGLSSLPSLDISCTSLSSIQNGSFVGMAQLKNLNASHSKISALDYNIFILTGAIEIIDFSFNELRDFNINTTELAKLDTLYLNNNSIKTLDSSSFIGILNLLNLRLSYNKIEFINSNVFTNQRHLKSLDVSFNSDLNVTLSFVNATKILSTLDLSGIKSSISFGDIKDISLTHLIISYCNVTDIKTIQLNELRYLHDLELSNNEITKLEVGSFDNLNVLTYLDLSHNNIKYIQPGIFKDNTMLKSINLSHNSLTAITYGIFHGLIFLTSLDISFNHIKDLQNERFYELVGLTVLIADHNKIESITAEEFSGTSLTKLSIGGNPIPCEVLVNLKRNNIIPFKITASNLYENNDENVDGVTCNRKLHTFDRITNVTVANPDDNIKVLLSIRDIMLEQLKNEQTNKSAAHVDDRYLVNITDQIQKTNDGVNKIISNLVNLTQGIVAKNNDTEISLAKLRSTNANNETNVLLTKILRVLTLNAATKSPPIQITKSNATYENLLLYINKIKQELEDTYTINKENIITELESKIDAKISTAHLNNEKNNYQAEAPKHEKLSASDDSKSPFTEICVILILVILVGFILFKVYKSGVFVRQRFSVSTRELPGSMDSTL